MTFGNLSACARASKRMPPLKPHFGSRLLPIIASSNLANITDFGRGYLTTYRLVQIRSASATPQDGSRPRAVLGKPLGIIDIQIVPKTSTSHARLGFFVLLFSYCYRHARILRVARLAQSATSLLLKIKKRSEEGSEWCHILSSALLSSLVAGGHVSWVVISDLSDWHASQNWRLAHLYRRDKLRK